MDVPSSCPVTPKDRFSSPTHLIDGVQKIDTVLIPAQHPTFSEEAGNEAQVFLRRAAASPIRGLQMRVELKRCDSTSKDIFEDICGLNSPMDINLPQPEPWAAYRVRSLCLHSPVIKQAPNFPVLKLEEKTEKKGKKYRHGLTESDSIVNS